MLYSHNKIDFHQLTANISMPTTNPAPNTVLNTLKCKSVKVMPEEKWMCSLPQVSKRSVSSPLLAQILRYAMCLLHLTKIKWKNWVNWTTKPQSFVSSTSFSCKRRDFQWTRPLTNLRCLCMSTIDTPGLMPSIFPWSTLKISSSLSIMAISVSLLTPTTPIENPEISFINCSKQVWLITLS